MVQLDWMMGQLDWMMGQLDWYGDWMMGMANGWNGLGIWMEFLVWFKRWFWFEVFGGLSMGK
ncbi:hypothetical protein DERP_015250 [Dermatophagoides pteronyssinus]|uniref:Uncharacterized protein n=1 Tax=Dermatophagoides pteronyssinus TaxID=6956 RepID=A0ABQ8IVU3_DERPT|nr:hypothetical protein DERP_015250 [Dermatophagoides pteronyssinus]